MKGFSWKDKSYVFGHEQLAAIFGGRTVVNTDEQIRHFRQVKASLIRTLGKTAAARLLARSIYVFSTGSNDISWGYLLNATMQQIYTPDQFTTRIINSLYDSVQVNNFRLKSVVA